MRPYQIVSLLIIVSAVSFIAGRHVAGTGRASDAPGDNAGAACCALPTPQGQAASHLLAPKIPTGSGLPCLVEFGSDECKDCQRMRAVLDELRPRLAGRLDIVQIDSDVHLAELQRFRLRMVPTQVLVAADGKELWRHEGFIPAEELLARTRPHWAPRVKTASAAADR